MNKDTVKAARAMEQNVRDLAAREARTVVVQARIKRRQVFGVVDLHMSLFVPMNFCPAWVRACVGVDVGRELSMPLSVLLGSFGE